MTDIRFSVITCVYNAGKVLERTLESVCSQTYAGIEHIIIDGASTDDTMDIVGRYSSANENRYSVVIVSEPDKGLYDAMNKALRLVSGDYVIFLNAGDKFAASGTLLSVAQGISAFDNLPGVIYGDTEIVDDNGTYISMRHLSPPEHLSWKSFRHGMLVCHQSFYALASIAKDVAYDTQYRFSADVDWCIRVMKEAEKQHLPLHNTHATLTAYLDGGLTVKNHRASLRERFRVMSRHYGVITTVLMHLWFVVRTKIKRI